MAEQMFQCVGFAMVGGRSSPRGEVCSRYSKGKVIYARILARKLTCVVLRSFARKLRLVFLVCGNTAHLLELVCVVDHGEA